MRSAAEIFVETLAVNVDNIKLSDSEFRQFVRNSLPLDEHKTTASASTYPTGTDHPCGGEYETQSERFGK